MGDHYEQCPVNRTKIEEIAERNIWKEIHKFLNSKKICPTCKSYLNRLLREKAAQLQVA
jgi:hypothetical protein